MPIKDVFKRIEYEKKWAERNRRKVAARKRKYYLKNKATYKAISKRFYKKHREKVLTKQRHAYRQNKRKILKRLKLFYKKNRERIKLRSLAWGRKSQKKRAAYYLANKNHINAASKNYYKQNRKKFIARNKIYYVKNKKRILARKMDYYRRVPEARLVASLRSRLAAVLNSRKPYKLNVYEVVGCSYPTLRKHIEKQFLAGMSWANRGKKWHLDHIIPMSLWDDKGAANHFSNLRPLAAKQNWSRGNRLKGHFIVRGKRVVEHSE